MLLVLLLQSVSGLFSSDTIATEGVLARFVSEAVVSAVGSLHVALQWPVYGLIALHLLAVLGWLLLKRQDLIRPMLSGDKYDIDAEPAVDTPSVRGIGLALMSLLLAVSIWLLT
jgi:cytochrome b